jgi:hypothetical protein
MHELSPTIIAKVYMLNYTQDKVVKTHNLLLSHFTATMATIYDVTRTFTELFRAAHPGGPPTCTRFNVRGTPDVRQKMVLHVYTQHSLSNLCSTIYADG